MKYNYIKLFLLFICLQFGLSCVDVADRKTTVEIEDNERHYYPILAGQQKDISFNIRNTGGNPLMVTDVITSCGCLKLNADGMFTIPPGKERILTLSYNSAKNIGYVKHYISLYGNFESGPIEELVFDINVVPDAMYTKDYEELHRIEIDKEGGLKNLVDGNENNRGYYMDEDFKKSIHDNK